MRLTEEISGHDVVLASVGAARAISTSEAAPNRARIGTRHPHFSGGARAFTGAAGQRRRPAPPVSRTGGNMGTYHLFTR